MVYGNENNQSYPILNSRHAVKSLKKKRSTEEKPRITFKTPGFVPLFTFHVQGSPLLLLRNVVRDAYSFFLFILAWGEVFVV